VLFFRHLAALLPNATTLYAEGTSIAPGIDALLSSHAELTAYQAPRGTNWPRAITMRVRLSAAVLADLADLAGEHAEPEICDHLHIYADNEPLLHWFDAFEGPFLLSKSVPLVRIERFMKRLNLSRRDAVG
jgi:hypothetical protein